MDGKIGEASPRFAWAVEQERLLWAVRVRWAVVLGFAGLVLACHPLGLFADVSAVLAVAALGVVGNTFNHVCVRLGRGVVLVTILAVLMDNVLIAYSSARTGGLHSPLVIMYSVQVVATAMLVDARAALLSAALAATCAAGLVKLEDLGWTGPTLLFVPVAALSAERCSRLAAIAWSLFLAYGLILLVFVGGFVSERLRRREVELADRNRHLALSISSLVKARDELAGAYQKLQQAEAQLLQTEKMRALGQLVAGVAHELNNPIGFISSNIACLRDYFGRLVAFTEACAQTCQAEAWRPRRAGLEPILCDLPQALDDCEEGARRAKRIVSELRTFARGDDPTHFGAVDVNQCLERTLHLLRHHFKAGLRLQKKLGELPPIFGSAGQLEQVFLNLMVNAIDALGGEGILCVESWTDSCSGQARVTVSDDGPGIATADLERVFEPFFSTKPVGQGTGIGLSLSYAIVQRHGGTLTARSVPGEGATFEVALPMSAEVNRREE